jgi:kumamolisin
MSHMSAGRLRVTSSLLSPLVLGGGCSDDSAGSVTEPASTGGTTAGSSTTSGEIPTTSVGTTLPDEMTEPVNPTNPDSVSTTLDPTTGTTTPVDPTTGDGTTTTTTDETTTGNTTGCIDGGMLCEIPPEEQVPEDKPDGVPSPLPGVYDDQGEAPLDNEVRALIGFPTRDRAALEARVADIYNPDSPAYGEYLTVDEWMTDHAPPQADYDLIKEWLASRGMPATFDSSNRMVVAFSGSVADFNATFMTTLHICLRKNPQAGNPPFEVYCTLESFTVPKFVADRTTGLLTADLPAATGNLPGEAGMVISDPPGPGAFDPQEIAAAYEFDDLYDIGFTGQGVKLGVVAAATFHGKDLQTFWKTFGITRALPQRVQMMEPVVTRITETILDTQWSSSMAPGADVITYEGPDARNTALLFVFNEAIARHEVSVLTDSFAHREDSEPLPLRHQYDEAALMGAALGITVISASGDSARPDIPCTSPYVVCVGGTNLVTNNGIVVSETAWDFSGSGDAKTFDRPDWQMGVAPNNKRATVDLALAADPSNPYWIRRFGNWESFGGTSFSAPVFAGMVAVINSYRIDNGEPVVGLLTPIIYQDAAVRATFRDVLLGATDQFQAKIGWDYPTGWGAPRAKKLADALP